ncbi:timeless-domain-containing protein [Saccharata proteae CBS 121410]|uniref:Topoisomerase 1-associated factor 1 n=1 Tax=Saccharata proteae CBS 121410 TaxID=1314787 RepID=A0A9P4HQ07_9PEZI|nr:timeless-domain-containing protein [Saccharata proteae CBS 121410]
MSLDDWVTRETVDPEVRAHVYSLVSAVGGSSVETDDRYVLGDDALACLKDIRRWIRLYDYRLNRYDVARCIAEANLVKGDLLEILALWPERSTNDKLKSKAALAALELLVPLTMPLEVDETKTTVNHHRHLPYLQLAHCKYKRCILHHEANILRTAVRLALPSMAEPRNERSTRDEGIITIVLYFIRNVTMINQPSHLPSDGDDAEISRSATIQAYHEQDIFQLLLTVASSMGDEFSNQDVIVLEILFHLLKGIDVDKLFMQEESLAVSNTNELRDLMQKEKSMLAGYARHAPSRHNRFGTMIWVKRDDEKMSTVSGQDILGNTQRSLQKMDKTKRWNKPRRPQKRDETIQDEFDKTIHISSTARQQLRSFVEEFLDSSFNPLFTHLRKAMENEAERVLESHPRQFLYLTSFFLQAERARRAQAKAAAAKSKRSTTSQINSEDESFALIAGVMNQETFILLNRLMQRSMDEKSWRDLNAGMKCFTGILLTVQEMCESSIEDDQEIAENIQNRIFYEETTHDRIVTILRTYNGQSFGYLDACTELAHVFVRMLERYSKQNVDLQVRSRRRARRKAKAAAKPDANEGDDYHGDEVEDLAVAQRTTSERKFDFQRFSARFMTQGCINTFVAFTRYYNDLSTEQLKRAHRFFYRVAFKMDLGMMLYRVDILHLFNKMIKGPDGLDPDNTAFRDWEEFSKQLFRRVVKKVEERPELVVEMLFSKIPTTLFYLEHGHEKEIATRAPRPPAELEVKGDLDQDAQIGVAVSLLINQNKSDHLAWAKKVLSSAAEERKAWEYAKEARKQRNQAQGDVEGDVPLPSTEEQSEAPSIVVTPDNHERRVALFKDNKLRLLLRLLGLVRIGEDEDMDATWIVPTALTSDELSALQAAIQKFEFDPPTYDDDKSAEDMVRNRKRRAAFDDSSDDDDGADALLDDEQLFPAGGPTTRKDALKELKKTRRKRRQTLSEEPDDSEKARRAEARRMKELEKRRKIKSELIVHSSDEETDEERDKEFFAAEEERRKNTHRAIVKTLITGNFDDSAKKRKSTKGGRQTGRKRRKGSDSQSEDHNESDSDDAMALSSRSSSADLADPLVIDSDDEDEDEEIDTPLSSQHVAAEQIRNNDSSAAPSPARRIFKPADSDTAMPDAAGDEEDEDEDVPVRKGVARRNVRAGFLVDSDSE